MDNKQNTDELEEVEYIEVGFSSIDIEVIESPITKTVSSDLYGLCVWEIDMIVNEGYWSDDIFYPDPDTTYNTIGHACWLTDDLSKNTIRLLKDRKYICGLVYAPNGQNTILNNGNGKYGNPFCNNGPDKDPILGEGVYYGGGYGMERAYFGIAQISGREGSNYADINTMSQVPIYYGGTVLTATKNEEIVINLYEMMCGIEINALNLTEGKIHVYQGGIFNYQKAVELGAYIFDIFPENPNLDIVFEMPQMPWGYLMYNPQKSTDSTIKDWQVGFGINIDYEYPNGDVVRLITKSIDPKRMVKYSMTIDVNELLQENNDSIKQNVVYESWTKEEIE